MTPSKIGVMNETPMKRHMHVATHLSIALLIGATLVASATPAAAAAPANDDFAQADNLPSTANGAASGSNLDATLETNEPGGTDLTVWWAWTAPADGTYLFDTCGTAFETDLTVYGGATLTTLVEVSRYAGYCFFEHNWFTNEQVSLTAAQGATYFVQVGAVQQGMGAISLNWWSAATPSNDAITTPTTLTGGTGSTTGTTRFATVDTGHDVDGRNSPSVWFTWTPPEAGTYAFDTCGSSYDPVLGLYTGTPESLVYVAFNDDSCVWESALKITVETIEPYLIAVAGYDSESFGDFVLHWRAEAVPANDNFADAAPIGGTSGTATGHGVFATVEDGEPVTTTRSLWWRWTAPANGLVIFDTCDSNFDTRLNVFTGTELLTLTPVVDDDDGCFYESMVSFDATAGTAYSILVWGTSSGVFDVVLDWQMGTPPDNDDFADAAVLSGPGGTLQMSTLFSTMEAGETSAGYRPHTVWWTWLAPADGPATFDTCGSHLSDYILGAYTGDAVNALAEVAVTSGMSGTCGYTGTILEFWAEAGVTYHIAFGSISMGDLVLHWPASGVVGVPTVTTHPQATTVTAGSTAQFTTEASGLPVPTVQWQVSTNSGSTWSDIADETWTTLYVPTTYAMDGYQYRAVFTNTEGSATTDAATLTVNALAPQVTTHPYEVTVVADSQASFYAAASGDPTPTVQWQVSTDDGANWSDVTDATSTTLSFTTAFADNGNLYRAVFTNPGGTATTYSALLSVNPNVSVTDLVATVRQGKITVTFNPTGTPSPTYFQCYFTGKGAKADWAGCSSGEIFKVSAKYVAVRAGYSANGPWGPSVTAAITRTR